jgi:YcaO-like protein with predicted kinase domain
LLSGQILPELAATASPAANLPLPERYSDRICSASGTLTRVMPLLESFGITRVARVTGLDRVGIPVWNAMRPNAKSLSIHQGKGISDDDARASATMEAIERSAAEQIMVPHSFECKASLASRNCIYDPLDNLLGLRQKPFADDEPLAWIQGSNLFDGSSILVPLQAVAIDRTQDSRYWQSSDGLASGNTRKEAMLHGLLERVERDADTLWSLERRRARLQSRFDHAALGDPVVDSLAGRIAAAGLRLVLFDMTSDLGIPAVSALIGPDKGGGRPMRYIDAAGGSGAHPVTARAAIRAITEAAQSRLTLISGARDDVNPRRYDDALSPALIEDLASPAAKEPPPNAQFAEVGPRELLSHVVTAVSNVTNRIFAVDLMPNEQRLAVAKVLVPDLENPEGARRQRYGARALAKLTVF